MKHDIKKNENNFGVQHPPVGPYILIKPLMSDHWGISWLARKQGEKKLYCVTRANTAIVKNQDTLNLIKKEIQALNEHTFSNVYTLQDVFIYRNHPYIISPYSKGETLAQLVKRQKLNDAHIAINVSGILKGLTQLHATQHIMGDLRPENVLITDSGVFLTQVGWASAIHKAAKKTGQIMRLGPAEYHSPELIQGKGPSRSSDIYAAGVLLHLMFTGKCPFQAGSRKDIWQAHLKQVINTPLVFQSQLDPYWMQLVKHALQKQPLNRFSSASEFLKAVNFYSREILWKDKPFLSPSKISNKITIQHIKKVRESVQEKLRQPIPDALETFSKFAVNFLRLNPKVTFPIFFLCCYLSPFIFGTLTRQKGWGLPLSGNSLDNWYYFGVPHPENAMWSISFFSVAVSTTWLLYQIYISPFRKPFSKVFSPAMLVTIPLAAWLCKFFTFSLVLNQLISMLLASGLWVFEISGNHLSAPVFTHFLGYITWALNVAICSMVSFYATSKELKNIMPL